MVVGRKNEMGEATVYNLYTGTASRLLLGGQIPAEYVLTIPYDMSGEFEHALLEWLKKKGIRHDNDARIEGTLEATRKHLEDLRELLKLTPLKVYEERQNKPPLGPRNSGLYGELHGEVHEPHEP
jgi:hypothetical protein